MKKIYVVYTEHEQNDDDCWIDDDECIEIEYVSFHSEDALKVAKIITQYFPCGCNAITKELETARA